MMKVASIVIATLALAADPTGAFSFTSNSVGKVVHTNSGSNSNTRLNMVLEKPKAAIKKISKLEVLKADSKNLLHPLKEVRPYIIDIHTR